MWALFFKNCPSLTKVKNENCWMATFDSLKEASCHTDCNAKNQKSFRWTIFEKIRLDRQKSPKKLEIFFQFFLFFSKLIMFIGFFNAYMKCHDPLSSFQQKLAMWCVPFWKNSGKTEKRVQFFWTFWTVKSYFFKNGPSK